MVVIYEIDHILASSEFLELLAYCDNNCRHHKAWRLTKNLFVAGIILSAIGIIKFVDAKWPIKAEAVM